MLTIAIAHQNPLILAQIHNVVAGVADYQVIWVTQTNSSLEKNCRATPPDLLLLDINLSQENKLRGGVHHHKQTLIQRLQAISPCAIVVITQHLKTQVDLIFRAMGHGALDVIEVTAPRSPSHDFLGTNQSLLRKITVVARLLNRSINLPQRSVPTQKLAAPLPTQPNPLPLRSATHVSSLPPRTSPIRQDRRTDILPPLVILGSSAGGPQALRVVLSQLPADFQAAIIIVQHIDRRFAPGLASWLDSQTPLSVQRVQEGSFPTLGQVWIAATDQHLVLQRDRTLTYRPEPKNHSCHPSIDVFCQSVAQYGPRTGIAVLLTGMGRDGAVGLKTLRHQGWHTIVQDAQTSAVYGMPKAAIAAGAAQAIVPLEKIAAILIGQHHQVK